LDYGVATKVLLKAVKRNARRFPADFMMQLTAAEWAIAAVLSASRELMNPPPSKRRGIGFTANIEIEK
jgi:hypothetical protein